MNTKQYYLGIDVAKNYHQASLLDERKKMIGESLRFSNQQQSFQEMLKKIKKSLPKKTNFDQITIGMESTGHYWINLNQFLLNSGFKNIQVINPIETQQLSKKRIRKVKNDKVDSISIAEIIQEKEKNTYQPSEKVLKLKKATRFYDKLKRQEKFLKKEITSLLEVICPEFEELFKGNIFLKTPLALLEKYNDLSQLNRIRKKEVFIRFLNKKSKGRVKKEKALKILETIKHSIGNHNQDDLSALQIKMLLSNLKMIQKQVNQIEQKMEELSDEFDCKKNISSVVGVSSKLASIAIAEIGDVNRFSNKNKLTAFAGLDASVSQSGDYSRKQGNHISKRGSKYLRKQLYYAAKTAILFDPELKDFYETKKKQGKHYNVIVVAVARKVLHRIYRVWKDDRLYVVRQPKVSNQK